MKIRRGEYDETYGKVTPPLRRTTICAGCWWRISAGTEVSEQVPITGLMKWSEYPSCSDACFIAYNQGPPPLVQCQTSHMDTFFSAVILLDFGRI